MEGFGKVDEPMENALVYWRGFNVTLFHSERLGGARRRHVVAAIADFTVEQGLMDLPLLGGVSTWSNNLSWFRLDQFLVSPEWELSYPDLM